MQRLPGSLFCYSDTVSKRVKHNTIVGCGHSQRVIFYSLPSSQSEQSTIQTLSAVISQNGMHRRSHDGCEGRWCWGLGRKLCELCTTSDSAKRDFVAKPSPCLFRTGFALVRRPENTHGKQEFQMEANTAS